MLEAETALLAGVQVTLIAALEIDPRQCDVELDDEVPAIAADLYIAVTGGGITPGKRHNTSGGVWDLVMSVGVTLYERIGDVARDRRRSVFMDRLGGLNRRSTKAARAIDFSYGPLSTANEELRIREPGDPDYDPEAEPNIGGEFVEPLRFAGSGPPAAVHREPYAAAGYSKGDPVVAMKRSIRFTGARYLRVRE